MILGYVKLMVKRPSCMMAFPLIFAFVLLIIIILGGTEPPYIDFGDTSDPEYQVLDHPSV